MGKTTSVCLLSRGLSSQVKLHAVGLASSNQPFGISEPPTGLFRGEVARQTVRSTTAGREVDGVRGESPAVAKLSSVISQRSAGFGALSWCKVSDCPCMRPSIHAMAGAEFSAFLHGS